MNHLEREGAERRPGRAAFWSGFVAGALTMYVFDPMADHRLRAAAASRMRGRMHRTARHLARTARFAWGHGQGAQRRLVHRHSAPPVDDIALLDRIESEIYRDPEVPKGHFNVEVARGVTVLRGQLPDQTTIDGVLHTVQAVEGVGEVRSLLHLPGTPAPNKRAALEASPTPTS